MTKEKSIEIFDKYIQPKVENRKQVELEKTKVTDQLKEFDYKLSFYRNENDFAMIASLKKEQNQLENDIVELTEQSNDEKHNINQDDVDNFKKALNDEVKDLSSNNKTLIDKFNHKVDELVDVYKELAENKVELERRNTRQTYVSNALARPDNWRLNIQTSADLSDDPFNTNTDPTILANDIRDRLFMVNRTADQDYYNGNKKW
ncbi:hypothetical protein FH142_10420 [Staphylococcus warneri]|uniref:hypothetical protein n=1 Tax=Staphylococcus warneri TaxID=1292 RepID=UPI001F585922|nr:hypothetical protein [Staphylococcus warneri]MCI2789877.1 hypothetical protein [Staphylococcus warneri]